MTLRASIWLLLLALPAFGQDSLRTLAGRALETGNQDGSALEARFSDPAALAADAAGNVYVVDSRNNTIRRISPNGSVSTIAGPAAKFDTPSGIAVSPQGLVVSDTGNHTIRRINPDASITTIAGSPGQSGSEDGLGAAARFDSPLGIAVATNGVIYVADCGNHLIRTISPEGLVMTMAGAAATWGAIDGHSSAARFNGPIGLALDLDGNLFVSDSNNHAIRKINPNADVITYAGAPLESGFADGNRREAKFFQPAELAFDSHGALYVADSMNHAIRKISPEGKVSTVTGFARTAGADDGDNGRARLYNPYGLAFLPTGQLVIADAYNQTIRDAIPPAELQLTLGRALSFNWNSILGKSYQIQIADPLLSNWLNFGDAITASNITTRANFSVTPGVGIFRLLAVP